MRTGLPPLLVALTTVFMPTAPLAQDGPTTGFEDSAGSRWTTHEEELAFLAAVDALSDRVEIETIGQTIEFRPLHLVRIGHPAPADVTAAQGMPVELHICSQHGNEPAGREACLIQIRELALTDDPELTAQLGRQLTLFIPTANPDGRANNSRTNALGSDLNRQHLQVDQPEVRAIGRVIRDYKPVINMDHHEYGPTTPVLYDDDLLILWPRNLNVYKPLRDMAFNFSVEHMASCAQDAGYSIDEYGLQAAGDLDLQQTAGDWDDGISRNAGGLRHSMGILIESATSTNPSSAEELSGGSAATRRRRVASQVTTIDCALSWMREFGDMGFTMTRESMAAKAEEGAMRSAPTYFDGQDEDTTLAGGVTGANAPQTFQDPPYCGFLLTEAQYDAGVRAAFEVHGITALDLGGEGAFVSMAQEAEPVIGLLLDARGERHLVPASGLDNCSGYVSPTEVPPAEARGAAPVAASGGGAPALWVLIVLGLLRQVRRAQLPAGRM